jgi:signal transduction histidine kinase
VARRPIESISAPIIWASVGVVLSIALLVGWTLVIANYTDLRAPNIWLLVCGILSYCVIMGVLIWFGVFLVRVINEGRRQTSFIDSVTHELKSPLASLKLCLETQARPELSEEQRRQLHEMMLADVDRLSVFIEDILVASRLTEQQRGYLLSDVHVADVARRCADSVGRRYHLNGDGVALEVPEDLVITTDVTALETVLGNLLDNAVKYSDPPVRVRLRAERGAGGVRIVIVDSGIGIPPEHIHRVFDRFYRAPREAVRERAGTGLGLYVVSALVKELGGRVRAISEGEGRGTTMEVILP